MRTSPWRRGMAAPYALLAGFGALFAVGTVAAALHGRLSATGVLVAAAIVVASLSLVAEPLAALPLGVIGWFTVAGFSHPPYADLRLSGPLAARAAIVIAASALGGVALGCWYRWAAGRPILGIVEVPSTPGQQCDGRTPAAGDPGAGTAGGLAASRAVVTGRGEALGLARQVAGVLAALAGLPLLTAALVAARPHLSLTDDLLIYLVAVVALAVVGGFWPAVLAAVAASLLLNWYFTPPLHTFTIDKPDNLLALLLFVTVAVAVSSVVHLAARRAGQAARSREEAGSLLALAQTVLGGADTPAAVLEHLVRTLGGHAELQEKIAGRWVRVAASGAASAPAPAGTGAPAARLEVRENLALEVSGQPAPISPGLLAGFGAQAAAALDRERLRTQAAQAEALAEANRMRTALLAAVSHDLRTPLASIKASVSSLRQTDVTWTAEDTEALLATIEQNADRLDGLIGNLLDMSRVHAGSLQPFLRPVTVDEVAPVALRGLDAPAELRLEIPDGLPLVLADPGLLERVLANLFSNALRHSPPGHPPELRAYRRHGQVMLEVRDHGEGVPDELKLRIFEPFARFDDRKAGVGLGLAVAKGFTEAMGGSIAAADTPGGGLTVRVTLPVASRDRAPVLGADP
jgi:two-component system sensor histidine kinase KdpD